MNTKGFTLVELVVVIMIIGILAAVAIPKFLDASNKAKASELPTAVHSILSAQRIYSGDRNSYANCPWADSDGNGSNDNIDTILGMQMNGIYFHYETDTTSLVTATVAKSFASLAKDVTKAKITEDFVFSYEGSGSDVARLKKLCSFLK